MPCLVLCSDSILCGALTNTCLLLLCALQVIESDVIGSWMARSKALKQWGCILEQNMWELRKQQAKDEAAMTASFDAYNLDWEVLCLAGLNSDCTSPAAAQVRHAPLLRRLIDAAPGFTCLLWQSAS